jgi:serine/threonine protein phosphatase PrpC
MNLTAFSLNEIGGRKNVEDAIMPKKYTPGMPTVFVVCDGVGGSSFGEVASEIATKSFYEILEKATIQSEAEFRNLLNQALAKFKEKVDEFVAANPSAANTSTTLTVAVMQKDKAYIAWCGDSKIYQVREGAILFRSRDHSLVTDLVEQGVITAAEAVTHPQRNIITRSLNSNTKQSDIDIVVLNDVRKSDWLLLCTDGLMEQFTEDLFPVVLGRFDKGSNYSEIINKLCYGKTKDNYSMYLLHIDQAAGGAAKKIVLPVILLLAAAGGWFAYSQMKAEKQPETIVPAATAPVQPDTVKSIMMMRPAVQDTNKTGDSPRTAGKSDTIKK